MEVFYINGGTLNHPSHQNILLLKPMLTWGTPIGNTKMVHSYVLVTGPCPGFSSAFQVIFLQSNMAKENPAFIDDFHIQTPLKLGFSIAMFDYRRVHQNSMVNCHRYPPFSDPYHILHHTSHYIRVAVPIITINSHMWMVKHGSNIHPIISHYIYIYIDTTYYIHILSIRYHKKSITSIIYIYGYIYIYYSLDTTTNPSHPSHEVSWGQGFFFPWKLVTGGDPRICL